MVVGVLVLGISLAVLGLLVPCVAKVRAAADRAQSVNNLKQIGLAMNNVASNTTTGDIPPAYGVFPAESGSTGSWCQHLIPYIEQWDTTGERPFPPPTDYPFKIFIAPADPRNPGTNGTISYGMNGSLSYVNGTSFTENSEGTVMRSGLRFPASFGDRPSNIIFVMERSGLDGAHQWSTANTVVGSPGNPAPFPQLDTPPGAYRDEAPQGFTSAGCTVSFGDGSVRIITAANQTVWTNLCDPVKSPPPSGW